MHILSSDPVTVPVKKTPVDFAGALISGSRSADIDPSWDIYAPLLGNWSVLAIDYADDGTKKTARGSWYFSRTLEGRAIQDVLVCPEFSGRSDKMSTVGNRYGNTFRTIDPKTHQWHVDWFNPVNGIHNELTARVEEGRIIQETKKTDGSMMRWVFEDITPGSFHWYGFYSTDGGKTWILSTEFLAKRMEI